MRVDSPRQSRGSRRPRSTAYNYGLLEDGRTASRREIVAWFAEHYPRIKKGTVTAHLVMMSTNAPSRVHYNLKSDGSDDVFFQVASSHVRRYDPARDPAPIYTHGETSAANGQGVQGSTGEDEDDEDQPEGSSAFAYEHDLRDYLARNLHLIEQGLRLYEDHEGGITGMEFPVGGRFIDILAVDAGGKLVVIELKVSRGYDRVVGQLLRYMGWIDSNLAEPGQPVRGVIIANRMSEDLCLACARLGDVQLFEYDLAVTLRQVGNMARGTSV